MTKKEKEIEEKKIEELKKKYDGIGYRITTVVGNVIENEPDYYILVKKGKSATNFDVRDYGGYHNSYELEAAFDCIKMNDIENEKYIKEQEEEYKMMMMEDTTND